MFSLALIALPLACGKARREPDEPVRGRGGESSEGGGSSTNTGGTPGLGGATSKGGSTSKGGGTSKGGSPSTGGAPTTGGSTAEGGDTGVSEGGAGGAVIDPPHPSAQVDLLFVVDNSIGMADKQSVLSQSAPTLIHRFLHPRCIDAAGLVNGEADASGKCASGAPEFPPVSDLHVGVITSSLGSHGGGGACVDATADDHAQLLGALRVDPAYPYATWENTGFLSWNTDPSLGTTVESDFTRSLRNMILSAGERGCGFEAPLEAMYRFLIDPQPPTSTPVVTDATKVTSPIYSSDPMTNPVVFQREEFLRPDSKLAIVMISDENDCSIQDAGQGWLVATASLGGASFRMPRATSACAKNPNDPCCASCASGAMAGCPEPSTDAACSQGSYTALDDNLNLRCFDQKRRFGFDLLYPLSRYVDGLTKTMVLNRDGKSVRNPLFPVGGRTPSMVFLTGILGVPWQDLATMETNETGADLRYLRPQELETAGRWDVILGQPGDAKTAPIPPRDRLMFETPEDRTVKFGNAPHPLVLGAALAPATSTGRLNAINGHESNIADNSTLQYACIAQLPVPRPTCATGFGCDCVTSSQGTPMPSAYNFSICDGTTQTYAKAHPSIRQLRVIRELAARTGNASPASVCWKNTLLTPTVRAADFGYDPAFELLANTMAPQLSR